MTNRFSTDANSKTSSNKKGNVSRLFKKGALVLAFTAVVAASSFVGNLLASNVHENSQKQPQKTEDVKNVQAEKDTGFTAKQAEFLRSIFKFEKDSVKVAPEAAKKPTATAKPVEGKKEAVPAAKEAVKQTVPADKQVVPAVIETAKEDPKLVEPARPIILPLTDVQQVAAQVMFEDRVRDIGFAPDISKLPERERALVSDARDYILYDALVEQRDADIAKATAEIDKLKASPETTVGVIKAKETALDELKLQRLIEFSDAKKLQKKLEAKLGTPETMYRDSLKTPSTLSEEEQVHAKIVKMAERCATNPIYIAEIALQVDAKSLIKDYETMKSFGARKEKMSKMALGERTLSTTFSEDDDLGDLKKLNDDIAKLTKQIEKKEKAFGEKAGIISKPAAEKPAVTIKP